MLLAIFAERFILLRMRNQFCNILSTNHVDEISLISKPLWYSSNCFDLLNKKCGDQNSVKATMVFVMKGIWNLKRYDAAIKSLVKWYTCVESARLSLQSSKKGT